jgi:hypothetical protein
MLPKVVKNMIMLHQVIKNIRLNIIER